MAIRYGTNAANRLTGTSLSDYAVSLFGNDILTGSGGRDWLIGGYGDDRLDMRGSGGRADGGAGTDTLVVDGGFRLVGLPYYFDSALVLWNGSTQTAIVSNAIERIQIGSTVIVPQIGTDAANVITGTSGNDYIKGLDGNDTIRSGAGNDVVSGGFGADRIETGTGNDVIDDSFAVIGYYNTTAADATRRQSNVFSLGDGNDQARIDFHLYDAFTGTAGSYFAFATYTIDGGAGQDVVTLTNNYSTDGWTIDASRRLFAVNGEGLKAQVAVLTGVEQVVDLANDIVWTQATGSYTRPTVSRTGTVLSEYVVGTSGNDTLAGNGGFDYFRGGAGIDTVVLAGSSAIYQYYGSNQGVVQTVNGYRGVRLDNALDTSAVFLNADIERIKFLDQPTAIYTFKILTSDRLETGGTTGNDFVIATPLTATAAHRQNLSLRGGDDHVIGDSTFASIDTGTGNDIVDWSNMKGRVSILGQSGNDTITAYSAYDVPSIATILGGDGNDDITYFGQGTIDGGAGDDMLFFSDRTTARGGTGNDVLAASLATGSSIAEGGSGEDVLSLDDISTSYIITKLDTGYRIASKIGGGVVTISAIEAIDFSDVSLSTAGTRPFTLYNGNGSANVRTGGTAIDVMNGGAGNDRLAGGGGNDIIAGDAGNDTLSGGAGDDIIHGGLGNDVLSGNSGFDTFEFTSTYIPNGIGRDRITDFSAGAGLGDVIAFAREDIAFDSFTDVLRNTVQTDDGALMTVRYNDNVEGTVLLGGILKTALVADDFIFI